MKNLRIVIADDDIDFRRQLKQVLELGTTYSVVGEGYDGADAIRLADWTRPDVVILDVIMPAVSGFTAAKAIKNALPEVFVIGLTGSAEMVQQMETAGADVCLVKSESLNVLFELLASLAQA